ncbi:conjugative transposon protein TraM [Mucilaginibacter sp. X5P1]|uniref:conjugative transposon protein TraM n=1 Tax=Mucilaginibacter sp. X5P1 TaxID=2723088 RepID=UPI00160C66DA|nr:conjugative transposon protein TraM [Mucilaginibacter sp. X5P1]MBB6137660.1 conjugative transposon TraM protein [Mucilaginibacter sp. X5P1]
MKINFKQPKYILPLVALPFICLFFYVYHSSASKNKKIVKQQSGFNGTVADVSQDVKKRSLEDKLDAYRDRYKDVDGATAVTPITPETSAGPNSGLNSTAAQQRQLDSVDSVMKRRFGSSRRVYQSTADPRDRQLADALNQVAGRQKRSSNPAGQGTATGGQDPMDVFKKQIAYMDSLRKASDPAWQKQQQDAKMKVEAKKADDKTLSVVKVNQIPADFNTVRPQAQQQFITAVIDENVTGYAGSRIRLRLLEPVMAGSIMIPKDSYMYALIDGFSGQRVTMTIKSILINGQLLPVKLAVYDQDGLPGLYVPDSQFRDFTKDLGTNTIQGVSIDNGTSTGSQFLMSTADKVFESTSSAIASAIRKNKARVKYNSYVYLIDTKNLNQ